MAGGETAEEQPQRRFSALQRCNSAYSYNPTGMEASTRTEASEVLAKQAVLASPISHEDILGGKVWGGLPNGCGARMRRK